MLNFTNSGDLISETLGAGVSVTSGLLYQYAGGLFGVAQNDADGDVAGDEIAVYVRKGRFEIVVSAGETAAAGAPVYFDEAINGVSALGVGVKVGYFVTALGASDTTADVVLIPDAEAGPYQTVIGKLDASSGLGIGVTTFGPTIPEGAVIVDAKIHVATTLTSSTDAATIALGVETDDADAFDAAIAISDGGNPWDAGTRPSDVGPSALLAALAGDRRMVATVAVEALTDGVLYVIATYINLP